MESARRVALWITEQEADAVMSVLLQAPESSEAPGDVTERLLHRVANVQRQFAREALLSANGSKGKEVLNETPRRRLYIRRTGRTRRLVRLP
jgi:hypothetical protein